MKIYQYIIISFLASSSLSAQQYELNSKKSSFNWKGYGEVGGFSQTGTIKAKDGVLTLDNDTIAQASIIIDMKSMKSENNRVANHLKNKDFFFVKKYSTATLVLRCIERDTAKVNLTIRGITHSVDIPIKITIKGKQVKAKGKAIIDRTLFGIKYNSSAFFKSLGDQAIKHDFDLSFDVTFDLIE